ncbi:MAG: RNA methyltransferase [Fibrobacter sp.]|uniref:THUMP domain-containing class I SAM-dependent RNA methyltransferase n=1 Tax=Fibrobacter sp. TaxID=35828 RepID=UPI002A914110|nr:RNA methyltransferase [Fibrobacter sp.]MDY6263718.1 RNA methyltransferase [Fibrobacter sp.]
MDRVIASEAQQSKEHKSSAFEKRLKRQVIGKPHRFQAVGPLGFEQTLVHELCSILKSDDSAEASDTNFLPHVTGDGKVEFTAKITDAWKAVAYSRVANRILMHLADFKAENFRELEKKAAEIPWELYLAQKGVHIHVSCKHSRLYHSDAIAERLYKIIEGVGVGQKSQLLGSVMPARKRSVATLALCSCPLAPVSPNNAKSKVDNKFPESAEGSETSAPPSPRGSAPNTPPQNLFVTLIDDRCTIWLDLAGEELYRRGHERFVNDAPLKETIAAGMILEAIEILRLRATHGVYPEQSRRAQEDTVPITLIDPMAGSGTFSLEAAYMASSLIPGICRDFALKHQPAFKEATWNFLTRRENGQSPTDERREVAAATIAKIVTSDISERSIEIIKHNIECSPLASIAPSENSPTITPQIRDFFSYTAKDIADTCGESAPIIVLNPPYGKRLDFDAPKLYTKIGRHLAALASGLKLFGKSLTVAILAPKDDTRDGARYTCTANLLRECPALSPENNAAAKHIVTSHGGLTLNVLIAKI